MPKKAKTVTDAPRWTLIVILAVTALTFSGSIDGEFVYDDTRQIEDNPLVLESGRFWEAMSSDVWAFRAEAGQPGSNYWRPTFVAWMIFNHRLFGLNPGGWHVTNILLHLVVTGLLFWFLRRLGVNGYVAGAIALLFGVHPVHVESVSWIAGSPDPLLGMALLGLLLLIHSYIENGGIWKVVIAVVLSLVGMGAKEVGIMSPMLVFALVVLFPTTEKQAKTAASWKSRIPRAGLVSAPFFGASVLYFLARLSVIGGFRQEGDSGHGLLEVILTIPAASVFYLRQIFLPVQFGPVYDVQPVSTDTMGLENFWIPLLILSAVLTAIYWLTKRGAVQFFGFVFAALILLPAFNIAAFPLDHIVHDRYLYLPILGVFMIVIPSIVEWIGSWRKQNVMRASRLIAIGAFAVAIPLAAVSFSYGKAWESDLALWERGTQVAPDAAFALQMHGAALQAAGRSREAVEVLDQALNTRATVSAVVSRADALMRSGRGAEAEALLLQSIQQRPDYHTAFERLAVVYQQQGRVTDAERVLMEGRAANPEVFCQFSTNLGVVQYLQGRKEEALATLLAGAERAENEATALCRQGLYHLAELHRELGNTADARAAYERFLRDTEILSDNRTNGLKNRARQRLAELSS